jgi:hypothetical protein
MPIKAQMADGTTLEFPDDTPDDVIDRAAQEYSAPRGSAGAAPEPVDSVAIPAGEGAAAPLAVDVNALPENMRRPDAQGQGMAALRSFGDAMTMNFADEIGSAIESGSFFSGPEYEALLAENAQLRADDEMMNPEGRAAGQVAGILGSMAIPVGAGAQVANRFRQAGTMALTGGGMQALSGAGAAQPGERTENLLPDFALGATIGGLTVPAAAVARRLVQALPLPARLGGNDINQSAANDVLLGAELDVNKLRQAAADFQARTGRGARLSDIMTPEQAGRFTSALGRSPQVRERITGELLENTRELPARLSRRVTAGGQVETVAEETSRLRAIDKSNYGAVENEVGALAPPDQFILANDILPYVSLPKATRDKVMERLEKNELTGLDFQNIRQSLTRFGGQVEKSGRAYDDLVTELDAIIDTTPVGAGFRQARAASAEQRSRIEGIELGQTAARPSQQMTEVVGRIDTATPAQFEGVAPGARGALFNQVAGNPGQSYALARQMDENPAFQTQLRAALPMAEAEDLIAYATQQRKAIDGLAALAKIPANKVEDALNNTEQVIDWGSALTGGAGAAFRANLVDGLARYAGVGRGAAERLAEDLLNPARRERVFSLLESAGVSKVGAREMLQGALVSAANVTFTGDRGAIPQQPQE